MISQSTFLLDTVADKRGDFHTDTAGLSWRHFLGRIEVRLNGISLACTPHKPLPNYTVHDAMDRGELVEKSLLLLISGAGSACCVSLLSRGCEMGFEIWVIGR